MGAAAQKAEEQSGSPQRKKHGRGKLFWGVVLGAVIGFFLLNEDRRNQLMDRFTGGSGPVDGSQWTTVASSQPAAPPPFTEPSPAAAEPPAVAEAPVEPSVVDNGDGGKKTKATAEAKKEPEAPAES